MTPFSFEWHWNVEYLFFMGFLYLALGIVGCGLVYALVRTWLDLSDEGKGSESPLEISYRSKYSEF